MISRNPVRLKAEPLPRDHSSDPAGGIKPRAPEITRRAGLLSLITHMKHHLDLTCDAAVLRQQREDFLLLRGGGEIGRASCRESV